MSMVYNIEYDFSCLECPGEYHYLAFPRNWSCPNCGTSAVLVKQIKV